MANESLEAELSEALRARLRIIGDKESRERDPSRHLADLQAASERITALEARLPANIHPQLRHYFERRSYEKALAWIEHDGLTAGIK